MSSLDTRRREEAAAELRQIGPLQLELAERRRALVDRIHRLELRAPVAGTVLGLHVTSLQSVLRAAEPVLYIVPQDRPLVITARIAPIQIDEVRLGEGARLGARALVPGMPVEVYLKTGQRSPLAYLLKPVGDYFARAFRES
jgi:HlyD family secretion protein